MKKNKIKLSIITNAILCFVLFFVISISFLPQSSVPIFVKNDYNAIYSGNTEQKNVSLMFNVYENSEIVQGILDVLSKSRVKATFFIGGCWADDNIETLNKIKESGNEIANHGYFHKDHKKIDYDSNLAEIKNCEQVIYSLCGKKTDLFAPPSGSFSENTLLACQNEGYRVIMWSKDTIDWKETNEDKIINRATSNLKNGDLVLMHPKQTTLKVLPRIIEYYKIMGYNVVTVSENLG